MPSMRKTRAKDGIPRIQPLAREFFARDPRRVARELLGKVLVRRTGRRRRVARIVETEAYLGTSDPAAHAAAGLTARNAVIFGPPGHAYIYFIYGNHYCLNVSCEREGEAGCVLIRALEPLQGLRSMARARALPAHVEDARLTSGPGRLAQAFSITRERDNGRDLTDPGSGLWLGTDESKAPRVATTPRIGLSKAADRKLRYIVAGNLFVSGR